MLDFDITMIGVFFLLYLSIIAFLKKRSNNHFLVVFTLFYIYLIMVIKYTQFPIFLDELFMDSQNYKISYNLVPLVNLSSGQFVTSMLNVLLFLPFGYLFFIMSRFHFKKTVLAGFSMSFLIELTQAGISLLTQVAYRVFDVNDLIFNTIGTFLGVILFLIFNLFAKKVGLVSSLKKNSIMNYITMK